VAHFLSLESPFYLDRTLGRRCEKRGQDVPLGVRWNESLDLWDILKLKGISPLAEILAQPHSTIVCLSVFSLLMAWN